MGGEGGTLKWSGGAEGQNEVDKELLPHWWQRLKGTSPRLPGGDSGRRVSGWVEGGVAKGIPETRSRLIT